MISVVAGIATGWGSQQRQDRALPWGFVARSYAPHTLAGVAGAVLLGLFAPQSLGWFVPLLSKQSCRSPLVALTSSLELGRLAAQHGLLLVPSETQGLAVMAEAHRLHAAMIADGAADGGFPKLVLEDDAVRRLHLDLLRAAPPVLAVPPEKLAELVRAARRRQTDAFSRQDWIALLSDAESLAAAA